jgi:excisionase family DNA binding protein
VTTPLNHSDDTYQAINRMASAMLAQVSTYIDLLDLEQVEVRAYAQRLAADLNSTELADLPERYTTREFEPGDVDPETGVPTSDDARWRWSAAIIATMATRLSLYRRGAYGHEDFIRQFAELMETLLRPWTIATQYPQPLSLTEAARQLGMSPTTLRVQIHNGRLRAEKIGRNWAVSPDEVKRYQLAHRGRAGQSLAG